MRVCDHISRTGPAWEETGFHRAGIGVLVIDLHAFDHNIRTSPAWRGPKISLRCTWQAISSITSAFYSPSRSYLKHQTAVWCGVFVGIGAAAFIAGLLQVLSLVSPCLANAIPTRFTRHNLHTVPASNNFDHRKSKIVEGGIGSPSSTT